MWYEIVSYFLIGMVVCVTTLYIFRKEIDQELVKVLSFTMVFLWIILVPVLVVFGFVNYIHKKICK